MKDYRKYDRRYVELVDIFLPDIRGSCKPYLVKVIHNTLPETLPYHRK